MEWESFERVGHFTAFVLVFSTTFSTLVRVSVVDSHCRYLPIHIIWSLHVSPSGNGMIVSQIGHHTKPWGRMAQSWTATTRPTTTVQQWVVGSTGSSSNRKCDYLAWCSTTALYVVVVDDNTTSGLRCERNRFAFLILIALSGVAFPTNRFTWFNGQCTLLTVMIVVWIRDCFGTDNRQCASSQSSNPLILHQN